ncbi:MAG: hypothetical protein ACTSVU_03220 [Promethearchaeota archaeon]
MAESSLTTTKLQNSAWKAVYSQQILMVRDLMVNNISMPDKRNIKEEMQSIHGTLNQVELNYFEHEKEALKAFQHRYPYIYGKEQQQSSPINA